MVIVHKSETFGPHGYKSRSSANVPFTSKVWSVESFADMVSSANYPLNTEIDDGSPWLMEKSSHKIISSELKHIRYEGPFTVTGPRSGWTGYSLDPHASDSSMNSSGTTAIARCAPTSPDNTFGSSLLEFAGERRLPAITGIHLWKERARFFKSLGGEYLNLEFGWKPFISDVRAVFKTIHSSADHWESYRKGSTHKTRVGYHFDEGKTTQAYGFPAPTLMQPYPSDVPLFPSGHFIESKTTNLWFKGAFKYYVPDPNGGFSERMSYYKSKAAKNLGFRFSPETFWNAAPWSWAIDWFANTGDMLQAISNLGTDGTVMQYGYVMSENRIIRTSFVPSQFGGSGLNAYYLTAGMRETDYRRCKRLPGTPYGFGVTWDSFSSTQLAVMAALGISRK